MINTIRLCYSATDPPQYVRPSFFVVGRQFQAFVQNDIETEDVRIFYVEHGFWNWN